MNILCKMSVCILHYFYKIDYKERNVCNDETGKQRQGANIKIPEDEGMDYNLEGTAE